VPRQCGRQREHVRSGAHEQIRQRAERHVRAEEVRAPSVQIQRIGNHAQADRVAVACNTREYGCVRFRRQCIERRQHAHAYGLRGGTCEMFLGHADAILLPRETDFV
jgi:hypothetical protein